jgi:hypothetical protein
LISSHKKYVLLFLRENQTKDESIRVKESLEGCAKEKKKKLEDFIHKYTGVFQEPKRLPAKREVENEIHLLIDSPLSNIELYR